MLPYLTVIKRASSMLALIVPLTILAIARLRRHPGADSGSYLILGCEFGGEFLPAEYGVDVGKLRHRRPVSL